MATAGPPLKPLEWAGASKKDLVAFPGPARRIAGHALEKAQAGDMHDYAKSLKGLGPGVLEISFQHSGGAFRTVYAVRFKKAVYVLHAFQNQKRA
ncbi:MAG: type II toxin-antitoxin system RelE/ParE family toxin [Rhodospirillales bacterium]